MCVCVCVCVCVCGGSGGRGGVWGGVGGRLLEGERGDQREREREEEKEKDGVGSGVPPRRCPGSKTLAQLQT